MRRLNFLCHQREILHLYSFENCLKQKGVGTDIISESMGHQDVNTTKAYLKELDSSVIDDACELLLDF